MSSWSILSGETFLIILSDGCPQQAGKSQNVRGRRKFLAKYLQEPRKSYTFAPDKPKKKKQMLNHNAYFYGYYFYFATSCEAVSRM
jgi:hypothetical protein